MGSPGMEMGLDRGLLLLRRRCETSAWLVCGFLIGIFWAGGSWQGLQEGA